MIFKNSIAETQLCHQVVPVNLSVSDLFCFNYTVPQCSKSTLNQDWTGLDPVLHVTLRELSLTTVSSLILFTLFQLFHFHSTWALIFLNLSHIPCISLFLFFIILTSEFLYFFRTSPKEKGSWTKWTSASLQNRTKLHLNQHKTRIKPELKQD